MDKAAARSSAIRFLARREHSHYELRRKLESKGFSTEIIKDVLNELQQENLLSDERYAEARADSRIRRGYGPRWIERELAENGVAASLVREVLIRPHGFWSDLAAETRTKKFSAAIPRDYAEKARQMRYLQYRGFSTEQIRDCMTDDVAE